MDDIKRQSNSECDKNKQQHNTYDFKQQQKDEDLSRPVQRTRESPIENDIFTQAISSAHNIT